MLIGIPQIISPEALKRLCEMGHGDQVVIGDGNFPAESIGKNSYVIRCDGLGGKEMLEAVLKLIPLDSLVGQPVTLMEVTEGDSSGVPIWEEYKQVISEVDTRGEKTICYVERQDFYEMASKAYLIFASGEKAIYANIILRKGVITTV